METKYIMKMAQRGIISNATATALAMQNQPINNMVKSSQANHIHLGHNSNASSFDVSIGAFAHKYISYEGEHKTVVLGDEYGETEFEKMNRENTQIIRYIDGNTVMIGQEEIKFSNEKELGEAIIARFAKLSLQGN